MTSSEERDERLAQLHTRLAEQARALATGADWARWLAVAARFPTYSVNNILLIMAQRPDATRVAGYRAWQALGRHVDKGQRGIAILAPIVRRPDPGREEADDEPTPSRVVGYRPTYVWDVTQTSGQPLPERPAVQLLTGQAPDGLWDELAETVRRQGFVLLRGSCGSANGLTDFAARTVRVRADVEDAQAVKTLAHELGHVLLHDGTPRLACRGIAEVEAESVAYLVTASRGLASDTYTFPYVASWASDVPGTTPEDVVLQVADRVHRAARRILDSQLDDSASDISQPPRSTVVRRADSDAAAVVRSTLATNWTQRSGLQVRLASIDHLCAVHADAAAFYRQQLHTSWVPAYLLERRLGAALNASEWDIGYAPRGWTCLVDHLRALGHDDATLEQSGLALLARTGHVVDRFRDRMTLSIRNERGDTVGFVARVSPGVSERTPKYLNSPSTSIYSKGTMLLQPLARQVSRRRVPVIVEGPLDAVAISIASPNDHLPLALCGTALAAPQASLVAKAAGGPGRPVVVAVDADAAGRRSALQCYRSLTTAGLNCWAPAIPDGSDPADVLATPGGAPQLQAALTRHARPLIDDLVDGRIAESGENLRWVGDCVNLVRDLAPDLALLASDQLDRQVLRLCERIDVASETVTREVRECQGDALAPKPVVSAVRSARDAPPGAARQMHQALHRSCR